MAEDDIAVPFNLALTVVNTNKNKKFVLTSADREVFECFCDTYKAMVTARKAARPLDKS